MHPTFGNNAVEPQIPWIARQARVLLECVGEPDQAAWPAWTRKDGVVMPAAAPHPAAGVVPGQQWKERQRVRHAAALQKNARRFRDAEGPRLQGAAEPVFGEHHAAVDETRQIDALAGGRGRRDQGAGRKLSVAIDVGENEGSASVERHPLQCRNHRGRGRSAFAGLQRPPVAAHRKSDRCLVVIHPRVDFSTRDGSLRSGP